MTTLRAKIGLGGRLVIPASQRKMLGWSVGDDVILEANAEGLRITSLKQVIADAQTLVRLHNPNGKRLSESLIRDRRAEARRE